jgi:hypothetical protein
MADVHLISMRPEMTGIVAPGKLFGVMAAGRPAVFVGPEHCESADAIRLAGCGLTVAPGDVDGLVAALTRLADDPSLARQMGERGRSAFLATYERKLGCERWHELIGGLTATRATFTRPHHRRRSVRSVRRGSPDPAARPTVGLPRTRTGFF